MKNVVVTGTNFFWGKKLIRKLLQDKKIQSILTLDEQKPKIKSHRLTSARLSYKPPFHFEWSDALDRSNADTLFLCPFSIDACYHDNHSSHLSGVQNSLRIFRKALELKVPTIVVLSSFLVYGARWENPAFITEDHLLLGDRNYQHIRGLIELEEACLAAVASDPLHSKITLLRPVNILGSGIENSLSHYLRLPVIPTFLGFDPPFQLIHEDDVVNAMIWSGQHPQTGPFNIASMGFLTLKGMCSLLDKKNVPFFHGLLNLVGTGLWKSKLSEFSPAFLAMLRYRLILDL
ncbi:MAG: NAD-dependent epimerase/dehydratase family protein, partial [Candidatus Magnetomorum sp.]|nr:NAD-dependent epimerase/dehydratase family protein [Candidatus Magnetomorum sp.]